MSEKRIDLWLRWGMNFLGIVGVASVLEDLQQWLTWIRAALGFIDRQDWLGPVLIVVGFGGAFLLRIRERKRHGESAAKKKVTPPEPTFDRQESIQMARQSVSSHLSRALYAADVHESDPDSDLASEIQRQLEKAQTFHYELPAKERVLIHRLLMKFWRTSVSWGGNRPYADCREGIASELLLFRHEHSTFPLLLYPPSA